MLVVADSSPLHYLILINEINILPALFDRVFVPKAVVQELSHPHAPSLVRDFIKGSPDWLISQEPKILVSTPDIDEGERAAISLALELDAELLLIDDLDGRRAALKLGVKITGTVGVLLQGSQKGLLDLKTSTPRLQAAGFHLSQELMKALLGPQQ